jgi:small subunit ribosomal protein S4
MAKYTGPKVRLSKRIGVALTPKAIKVMERRPGTPGQHKNARRGKLSNFGEQLLEKQRLRFHYNISEKTLKRYFQKAKKKKGNTVDNLFQLLESRLDTLALRAGFAPTIYAARQLVSHGHLKVNGFKVNLPGFLVSDSDVVSISDKAKNIPFFQATFPSSTAPSYLEVDKAQGAVRFVKKPERSEVPVQCEAPLVVEYYSR